eukprot:2565670-Prymnesium_polylepis.2
MAPPSARGSSAVRWQRHTLDAGPRGGRDAARGALWRCCRLGAAWRGWVLAARTPGGTAPMTGVGGSRVSSPWREQPAR